MPKVGNKKFPYTEKGEKEAKKYSKKVGIKEEIKEPKGKKKVATSDGYMLK